MREVERARVVRAGRVDVALVHLAGNLAKASRSFREEGGAPTLWMLTPKLGWLCDGLR